MPFCTLLTVLLAAYGIELSIIPIFNAFVDAGEVEVGEEVSIPLSVETITSCPLK